MKKNKKTRFVILGLLTIEPLSGYDMRKLIEKSIGHFWAESNGQIYPAITELLKEKLIEPMAKREDQKKRNRSLYAITNKGRVELKKWLKEGVEKNVHRDEGLLKLFFGSSASPKDCIRRLREREEANKQQLAIYRTIQTTIGKECDSPHYPFWLLTLNNGIKMTEAEIEWCRESITTLEQHEKH